MIYPGATLGLGSRSGEDPRIVLAHDLARGKLRRVTRWEWLTGITDDEREQLRRELDDDA